MARYKDFEDAIDIPQFFFTREMYDLMQEYCNTIEDKGYYFELLSSYALTNTINNELAQIATDAAKECFDQSMYVMYSGLNKYRWDYFNGKRGQEEILKRKLPKLM